MELLFVVVMWGLLAAGVAGFAKTRGRSWFGYFLLSFFFSPLLGLIIVLITKNLVDEEAREAQRRRDEESRDTERTREHEKQLESLRALANAQGGRTPSQTSIEPSPISVADELEKLANLREKGVLTSAEFETQKNALLQKHSV